MHNYKPPRTNHAHIIIPLALFVGAVIFEVACIAGASWKAFLQIAVIVLLTAGIELTARFALRTYCYTLTDYDESPANTLVFICGQRKRLSRTYIMMDSVIALAEPGSQELHKGCRRYNFCNTLLSSAQWRLYFNDPGTGEISVALLELDNEFAGELRLRIPIRDE